MSLPAIPEPRLITRCNEHTCDLVPLPMGDVEVFSARSPTKISDNEDAAAVIPVDTRRSILAVADGVGGQPGGATAARRALEALIDAAARLRDFTSPLRSPIMEGIEHANADIMELGIGAATTLVALEVDGDTVRPYHVGDSMILVVGQRGKIIHQTVPHSPVGYAVEAGLINEEEAIHHEERHLVSNVLGTPTMRIEVGPSITLKALDTVLLASDGVFDNLHVTEIVDIIRVGPLEQAAKHLASAAETRMLMPRHGHPSKPDDTTFLLFRRHVERAGSDKQSPHVGTDSAGGGGGGSLRFAMP